jgi:hypothetical protein
MLPKIDLLSELWEIEAAGASELAQPELYPQRRKATSV